MMTNPKAKASEAAKRQSYATWLVLGILGHIFTVAWTKLVTPRMPLSVDEESPTGRNDHDLFEKEFQRHAKRERERYAWMGAAIGGPIQLIAAVVSLGTAMLNMEPESAARYDAAAPTEMAAAAHREAGGSAPDEPGAGSREPGERPATPADAEAGEDVATTDGTNAGVVERTAETAAGWLQELTGDESDPRGEAADNATVDAAVDATDAPSPNDCDPGTDPGRDDCAEAPRTNDWVEPTGWWRGRYGLEGFRTTKAVEIVFGGQVRPDQAQIQYPDSNCSGRLTPTGTTGPGGTGRQYREELTSGHWRCIDNGLVTLWVEDDGTRLRFEWLRGNGSRRQVWSGTLTEVFARTEG